MQIKELLLGVPVLIFILWVFAAPAPQERIVRLCQPIQWVGNVATSTTALSAADKVGTTARWSDKLSYSCQYMVWRLVYQEDYSKAVAAGLAKPITSLYGGEAGTSRPGQLTPVTQPVATTAAEPTVPAGK